MKKTVFTICSVLTVCAVIIMSCEKKDDPNMHKVYYNTQPGYSTGNPYASGGSGTGAVTTTSSSSSTSTTGSTCASTLNGATATTLASGSNIQISAGSSFVNITFAATPTAGSYAITTATPTGMQCNFSNGSAAATTGSVTVATGPNKVTFSGITCGSSTYSGTGCY